jgi:alkylation response protein AidB-like acyl-CoA dehydrogenase
MTRRVEKVGGGSRLNDAETRLTNSSIADVAVVEARRRDPRTGAPWGVIAACLRPNWRSAERHISSRGVLYFLAFWG